MSDHHEEHPLTVVEKVPTWVHDTMTDMGYDLMSCSWANAMYSLGNPPHNIEMYFFLDGQQVRLLATSLGDTYESAFCADSDTDLLHAKIATLRQRLRERHV